MADLSSIINTLSSRNAPQEHSLFRGVQWMRDQEQMAQLQKLMEESSRASTGYTQAMTNQLRQQAAAREAQAPLEALQRQQLMDYIKAGGDTEDIGKIKKLGAERQKAIEEGNKAAYEKHANTTIQGINLAINQKNPALARKALMNGINAGILGEDTIQLFEAAPIGEKSKYLQSVQKSLVDSAKHLGDVELEQMRQKGETQRKGMDISKPSEQAVAQMMRMIQANPDVVNDPKFQALAMAAGGGRLNPIAAGERQAVALDVSTKQKQIKAIDDQLSSPSAKMLLGPDKIKELKEDKARLLQEIQGTTARPNKPMPSAQELLDKYAD